MGHTQTTLILLQDQLRTQSSHNIIFTFYLKPNNTPPTAPSTSFISFNKSCDHTTTRHYLAPLIKNDSRKRTSHQSLLQGLDRRFHRLHRVPRRPCQMEEEEEHEGLGHAAIGEEDEDEEDEVEEVDAFQAVELGKGERVQSITIWDDGEGEEDDIVAGLKNFKV